MIDVVYNENDPFAVNWCRGLVIAGKVPHGRVDSRSIVQLQGKDCGDSTHFFAGILGWPLAIEYAGWPEDVPVWTGSCPCFPEDTLILTLAGLTPIKNVSVGDMVLTHTGKFRKVLAVGSEVASCIRLRGQGHYGIVCTRDHPFYSRVSDKDTPEWTSAEHMLKKTWATVAYVPSILIPPLPHHSGVRAVGSRYKATGSHRNRSVHIGTFDTAEQAREARLEAARTGKIKLRGAEAVDVTSRGFARFLGYWVGDGWTTNHSVCLCGSLPQGPLLERIFQEAGIIETATMERTASRIRCHSKFLSGWLNANFGKYAHEKRIPTWLFGASVEYREAFLEGYFLADGTRQEDRHGRPSKAFSTVSKNLAVGLRILLNTVRVSATVRKVVNRRDYVKIEGRILRERPYYRITAYESARSFRFTDLHGWGLVREISRDKTQRVYNLSVEEDQSYTADGIVVHNCQPFSDAGKRQGQSDERHLWPEMLRLIKERKELPPAVFGEQTESKLAREWLAGVRADLEGLGYRFGAADLPSCSVGAPHIRQRFFWGAILDSDSLAARLGRTTTWRPRGPLAEKLRKAQRSIELHDGFRLDASGGISNAENVGRGSRVSNEQETSGKRRNRSTEHRGADRGDLNGVVDAPGTGAPTKEQRKSARGRVSADKGVPESFRVGDAVQQRLEGLRRHVDDRSEPRWFFSYPYGSTPATSFWNDFRLVRCRDGKIRRVGAGVARGMADGVSGRMGKIRGFGNANNPALAAIFVRSFIEAWVESR